jgi:hypothetical protein
MWGANNTLVPTSKGEAPSLAPQRGRWAAPMHTSSRFVQTFPRKARSAESAAEVSTFASRTVASRLCSSSKHPFGGALFSNFARVPSFRAPFPLAHQSRLGVASSLVVSHRVAVACSSSLFHHRQQSQRGSLPTSAWRATRAKPLAPQADR